MRVCHAAYLARVARSRLRDIGTEPDPRFSLAGERTDLAWNCTALALIGAGIAAWELLDIGAVIVKAAVALIPIPLGGALALVVAGVVVVDAL